MLVGIDKNYPSTPARYIRLSDGLMTTVDADLYDELNKYHWFAKKSFHRMYAVLTTHVDGKKVFIRMHRIVAKTPDDQVCHHINKNPLDNRRANLQNMSWYDHTKLHSWR